MARPPRRSLRDQAIADAGRIYAEAIARQDARPAREAAREALGRTATPEQIGAWIADFRPPGGRHG